MTKHKQIDTTLSLKCNLDKHFKDQFSYYTWHVVCNELFVPVQISYDVYPNNIHELVKTIQNLNK